MTLKFRLAGVPVRVEAGFWIIALLMGMRLDSRQIPFWIGAMFVSILVHEMGHAIVARAFGAEPEVTLYMMGGLTRSVFPEGSPYSRARSFLVTLAGPGAGFVLAAIVFAISLFVSAPSESTTRFLIDILLLINVAWGVINLAPVLPLDGGNLLRAVLSGPGPEVGLLRTLWVSAVIGPSVAALAYIADNTWIAMLFAFFTISSGKQLLEIRRVRSDRSLGLDDKLERAHAALLDDDVVRAVELGTFVGQNAKTIGLKAAAWHIVGFAELQRGAPAKTVEVLEKLPPESVDPFLLGAGLLALERAAEAVPYLERAVEAGRQPRAIDLLIEALEQSGDRDQADRLRRSTRND